MKLTKAIDLFPTLRGVRAGVDEEGERAWFYDADAFLVAARTHGSGATLCACLIVSLSGHSVPKFTLGDICGRLDSEHTVAALAVFEGCIGRGAL